MNIMIGNDYKLTADMHNVILNRRTMTIVDGVEVPSDNFKQIAFYPNVPIACAALLTKDILSSSEAESIQELMEFVKMTEEQILTAVKEYVKEVKA